MHQNKMKHFWICPSQKLKIGDSKYSDMFSGWSRISEDFHHVSGAITQSRHLVNTMKFPLLHTLLKMKVWSGGGGVHGHLCSMCCADQFGVGETNWWILKGPGCKLCLRHWKKCVLLIPHIGSGQGSISKFEILSAKRPIYTCLECLVAFCGCGDNNFGA